MSKKIKTTGGDIDLSKLESRGDTIGKLTTEDYINERCEHKLEKGDGIIFTGTGSVKNNTPRTIKLNIDTDTLEFKSGKLSAKATPVSVDGTTIVKDSNGKLSGNYTGSGTISVSGRTISWNGDNYYTKTQINNSLNNYYNKTEITELLSELKNELKTYIGENYAELTKFNKLVNHVDTWCNSAVSGVYLSANKLYYSTFSGDNHDIVSLRDFNYL